MRTRATIWIALFIVMGLLSACADATIVDQPRLIAQSTVDRDTVSFPTAVPTVTDRPPTQEIQSPLENITVEAEFVLVTPTLPPSKTPTLTPTVTPTPTITPSPTQPVTSTATTFLLPTSEIVALTAPAQQAIPQVCDSTWFFIEPRPASCPMNPPLASQRAPRPAGSGPAGVRAAALEVGAPDQRKGGDHESSEKGLLHRWHILEWGSVPAV